MFDYQQALFRKSIMGKSAEMRGTSTPTSSSLSPSVFKTWHAHVSPPITNAPSVVPKDRGPFFTLMPHKFCGVPVVNRQWGFPVSKNTLAALYLPGMLQKRNSGGCGCVGGSALLGVSLFFPGLIRGGYKVDSSSRCAANRGSFSSLWSLQIHECSRHVCDKQENLFFVACVTLQCHWG